VILILGLGISGLSLVEYISKNKYPCEEYIVWDDKKNTDISIINWDSIRYVAVSPGINYLWPEPHFILTEARRRLINIISDIDIVLPRYNGRKIGITGTNGKSTTVMLINHILNTNCKDSLVGGNIGIPVTQLDTNTSSWVLELSSYQIESSNYIPLDIAILLDITPHHQMRHGSFANYSGIKTKILAEAKEYILSTESSSMNEIYSDISLTKKDIILINNKKGYHFESNIIKYKNKVISEISSSNIHKTCVLAAYATAKLYGISDNNILDSIMTFKNLPHREEVIFKSDSLQVINNSKGTNRDSGLYILSKYENIIWICGGTEEDINGTWDIPKNVKHAFVIGKNTEWIQKKLASIEYTLSNDIESACWSAYKEYISSFDSASASKKLTNIILSPCAPSIDQFNNFEDRGNKFKKIMLDIVYKQNIGNKENQISCKI
jgi:UDP-N-acetylmuramoylalanine--D-glutamate ligase